MYVLTFYVAATGRNGAIAGSSKRAVLASFERLREGNPQEYAWALWEGMGRCDSHAWDEHASAHADYYVSRWDFVEFV